MLRFFKRLLTFYTLKSYLRGATRDSEEIPAEDPCESEDPPAPTDEIRIEKASGRSFKAKCGHLSSENVSLNVYGVSVGGSGNILCPDCMLEKAGRDIIRCAACGLPILPGEGVAVYAKSSKLPYGHVARDIEGGLIGCLRWECCPSGCFFAGHWCGFEKGFVPADFEDSAEKP